MGKWIESNILIFDIDTLNNWKITKDVKVMSQYVMYL